MMCDVDALMGCVQSGLSGLSLLPPYGHGRVPTGADCFVDVDGPRRRIWFPSERCYSQRVSCNLDEC